MPLLPIKSFSATHLRWIEIIAITLLGGLFAVALCGSLSAHYVYFNHTEYLHDIWMSFDMAQRTIQGQIPHTDFYSPLGCFYFGVITLAVKFFSYSSVSILIFASLLAALIAFALGGVSLSHRLSPLANVMLAALLFVTMVTPREITAGFLEIPVLTHLAPYNRWSWGFIALVALYSFLPFSGIVQNRFKQFASYVAIAVMLAILFYLKITFFIIGLGFLLVGLVILNQQYRPFIWIGLILGAILLGVDWLTPIDNQLYWHDIKTASSVAGGLRLKKFLAISPEMMSYGLMAIVILRLTDPEPASHLLDWVKRRYRPILATLCMLVGGWALLVQTNPFRESILYLVALLFCYDYFSDSPSTALSSAGLQRRLFGLLLVCMVVGSFTLVDAYAIVKNKIDGDQYAANSFKALNQTPLSDLRLRPEIYQEVLSNTCTTTTCRQMAQLIDGYQLLKQQGIPGSTLILDFADPFATLLHSPAPKYAAIWWHKGRTFNDQVKPPAALLFKGVNGVLISHDTEHQGDDLRHAYAGQWESNFTRVYTDPYWELWVRKSLPQPGKTLK